MTSGTELKPTHRNSTGGLQRRDFLMSAVAISAALGSGAKAMAQQVSPATTSDILIRGGHVLTMDGSRPDLPVGDVLVRDGKIAAVGQSLEASGAEVVDAADMIVMPGLVDTHSHLWNAFLRGSIRGDDRIRGYFPTTNRAAPLCTPQDAYESVRFGLMEALLSGTTCVHNFSHNTRSVAHADAEIEASLDVGTRTRFSYGTPGRGERLNVAGVRETIKKWGTGSPLVTLGVNLQTPAEDMLKKGEDDPVFLREVQEAKSLGMPIAFHNGNNAVGLVGLMNRHNLLGPDILMVHAQGFTQSERETMVAKGVHFSMSPAIEMPYSTARNGYIQFGELERMGAVISLSVDASSAMATADYFTIMRALQWSHKQRSDIDRTLEPKRILEIATLGGAKALGLDDRIGSLTPGKWADIILVRKTDFNMVPVIDPYYSLVYSGSSANVDTVMVGGNILLRKGVHKSLNVADVARSAGNRGRLMHEKLEKIIAEGQENQQQMNRKG